MRLLDGCRGPVGSICPAEGARDKLSRSTGRRFAGGTMTYGSVGRLPDHRAPLLRWNPGSDEMRNAEENLTTCRFGCKTGVRHSGHCGQQTPGVLVTWRGQNLLRTAGLYDFALMKNGDPVANSSDRSKIM